MTTRFLPVRCVLAWLRTEPGLELLTYGACLLSPLLFFGRPLLMGRVLLTADLLDQYWPYRELWATYIREGAWPLWNPYLFSGMPFLGDFQFAALYPLNLLFLVLPSLVAIQVYALLGYALLAAFTYYYMRTLSQSRLAGLCAAFSLSYGLFMIIHWPHLTIVHCIIWLPLQMGLTERLATTKQARYAILLALALAMQVLSGHPQFLLYSALVLGSYQLAHVVFARQHRGRLSVCFGTTLLLGVMLSAVQLLPAMELAVLSSRQTMSYAQFSIASLRPVMLIQLVMPFLFGAPSEFLYHVRPFILGWDWELVFYAGAMPVLCLLSLVTVRRWAGWRESFWWAVLVWGLVFALGHNTPIFPLLYRVPVYNWFRVAGRHLFLASLALAMIAGLRIEYLLRASRRVIAGTFGCFLITITALIAFTVLREADALRQHYGTILHPELLLPLLTFSIMFLVLWPFGDGSYRQRRPFKMLLVGLMACDLLLTSATTVPSIPRSTATDHFTEFQELAHTSPYNGKRFWHLASRHISNNYLFASLPFATSYNPLAIHRYVQLAHFRGSDHQTYVLDMPEAMRETLFNLLDVGYLLVPKALADRSLLDVACEQRIGGYCFVGSDIRLELSPGKRLELPLPSGDLLTGVGLVSALAYSASVPDQTPVAQLTFLGSDDDLLTVVPLLTGVHTAEWAADCLPSDREMGHGKPLIAASWSDSRSDGTPCQGHTYFAAIDIWTGLAPSRLIIQNTSAHSTLLLDGLSLRFGPDDTVGYALEAAQYDAMVPLQHPDWIAGRFAVYTRQPAWGHAWPVGRAQAMSSTVFLQALEEPDSALDLTHVAYVDEADLPAYLQAWPELLSTHFDANATVRMTDLNPNTLTLEVTSTALAFVVLSEVYYPGWLALVDGEKTALLRVDHTLRGVIVPSGAHTVEVVYRPPLVYWGLALGGLGLGLAIAFAWLSAKRGKMKKCA